MFDSLADRIRADEPMNKSERYIRLAITTLIAVVVFGGLYMGVRFLE